jgi:glycosyltransferase involved in cell wall biosynthesis/predicted SAM-dependent methyltransferase
MKIKKYINLGCGIRHHPSWINIDFKSKNPTVTAHDLTKGIPAVSETCDAVYHSHLLEHFSKEYAPAFLKDCHRVLKPNGIIRVVVPDLENIAKLYLFLLEKSLKGEADAQKRYEWIILELLDQMVRNFSGGSMLEYWRQNPMPAKNFVIERMGSEVKDSIKRIRSSSDETQSASHSTITLDPLKIGQFRLSGEVHQWMYDRYSLYKLLQEAGFQDIHVCSADESGIPDFNSYLLDIEADGSIRKPDSLFMEARKPLALSRKFDINTSPSLSKTPNHSRSKFDTLCRSNFFTRNTNPNIVHLCTLDHGGAGVAALRLHLGLLAKGMNSDMLVLHANSGKPRIHAVRTMAGHQSQAAWKVAHDRWQKVLTGHPRRPLGLELFTDTTSDALITNHHIFKQADIINLHWIPGLIDIQSMPKILSEKRVLWTLHDQNAFTGGCHYTGDCLKFQTFCHACPQLGSKNEKDLAFRQWRIKKKAYDAIDFEIITPSKWLAEQAKASALFAGRQISVIPYGLPLGLFQPRLTQNLRQKFGLCEGDFVLMFGAHAHTNRKGFAYLKQLLEVIPTQLQGKRVVAAAFGHLDGGLSKRIPMLELGFIAEPSRLADLYSMADVYVLPAVEDNLPNTVMEAMACGTPVVGFEIGGMPDMVRHGETGWLAQLGDIDGLVQGAMWARKFGGNARKSIATLARQYFNDSVQAKKYRRLYSEVPSSRDNEASPETLPSIPLCDPNHFEHFSYAKNNHFIAFSGMDLSLYGKPIDPQRSDLKRYQDTLILTFIAANIPAGARILEIGGGNSRILAHLAAQYECWNIDKFEGVGSGPKQAEQAGYKIVLDYMGNSNPELPDDYFDFVFSISALEHTPNDPELYASILRDITKALKPEGWSLHLFDVVFKPEGFWTNHFLPYLFENTSASYPMPDPEVMQKDQDTYFMSNDAYDKYWKKITGKSYEEFGLPTSINILWQKLSKTGENNPHKYYPESKKNNDTPTHPIILTRRTHPSVSIVTPSFNQADFLEECIDSILSQSYLNLEYVIMDGGSTDGSVDIIKKYKKYLKYWQSKKDLGQYWAINEGFKHTTGEVMAWLNSDDKYHSQSLYKIANFFDSTPESEWVMGRPTVWNTQGELIHVVEEIPSWSQKIYLEGNYGPPHIQQESTFWKRSIWNKSGGYIDINLKYAGDMELWSRFFRHTNLHILDDFIGGFRTQPNSKTYISMDLYNKEADIIISRERKIYNYE